MTPDLARTPSKPLQLLQVKSANARLDCASPPSRRLACPGWTRSVVDRDSGGLKKFQHRLQLRLVAFPSPDSAAVDRLTHLDGASSCHRRGVFLETHAGLFPGQAAEFQQPPGGTLDIVHHILVLQLKDT